MFIVQMAFLRGEELTPPFYAVSFGCKSETVSSEHCL